MRPIAAILLWIVGITAGGAQTGDSSSRPNGPFRNYLKWHAGLHVVYPTSYATYRYTARPLPAGGAEYTLSLFDPYEDLISVETSAGFTLNGVWERYVKQRDGIRFISERLGAESYVYAVMGVHFWRAGIRGGFTVPLYSVYHIRMRIIENDKLLYIRKHKAMFPPASRRRGGMIWGEIMFRIGPAWHMGLRMSGSGIQWVIYGKWKKL
ncbi:MAG: hypothetical protein GXO27_07465 [Chlorobi bacterium]|nr:hypothetical protein [Chlorobiota bacterium]